MALAELIVAKTALSGALFRPDPRPCSRDDIDSMHILLADTIAECSPRNVQRCKQWALANLVPSSARIAPFCKYLIALSKSFGGEKDSALAELKDKKRLPSVRRRRLHILYILNDILYHVKHRNNDDAFAQKLEPTLPALFRSAAAFTNCPKHFKKLNDLVCLWEEKGYFPPSTVQQLRTAIEEGPTSKEDNKNSVEADNSAAVLAKAAKSTPWVMPAMHGDPSTPWYDLPAGNWLPILEPNSTRPMNPAMIKPLVLSQGPADKKLVEAVKKLLDDVDRIYGCKEVNLDEPRPNIGPLGEPVEIDEVTGEIIGGETYYGWSRPFCEKMKRRLRGQSGSNSDDDVRGRARSSRSYSRSRSWSHSRRRHDSEEASRSPIRPSFKIHKASPSPENRERGRGRSRDRGRSYERSRSLSSRSRDGSHRRRSVSRHGQRHSRHRSRSASRSLSRRRSRSHSGTRGRPYRQRSRSRSRSRSHSYDYSRRYRSRSPDYSSSRSRNQSPPSQHRSGPGNTPRNGYHPPPTGGAPPAYPAGSWTQPPAGPQQQHRPPYPPPPSQMPFPMPPISPPQANFAARGFPIPPPHPSNYQGSWPPMPPQPIPQGPSGQHPQNYFQAPQGGNNAGNPVPPLPPFMASGWPPPPPPPPPGSYQQGLPHPPSGPGGSRGGYGRGWGR